ncbi:hypothetical protein [Paraburkholderia youngii]|uniref:hypothetical protein n=1 Tax=Paraburkholderia youngii TaxID=2782701 RepID=UPI003D1CD210
MVVTYRYSRDVYTHRIASEMLKQNLPPLGLFGRRPEVNLKAAQTYATIVAAGLKLIGRETPEPRIMKAATAAREAIEAVLLSLDSSLDKRLDKLADNWAEMLSLTPEIAYTHTLPLDDSNFLTHLAEAELAMRDSIE